MRHGFPFFFGEAPFWTKNKYADVIFYTMIDVVRSALSGIRWTVDSADTLQAARLRLLLDSNLSWIYKTLMTKGVCYLEYHDNVCKLHSKAKGAGGFVIEISSNEYRWGQGSKLKMLAPYLCGLDARINADLTLIEGLGALGIISPEKGDGVVSYGDEEREQIQKEYAETYGVTRGKWKMLITPQAVKYQQIHLPIKDLALHDGISQTIKMIAGYMRVPRELLPISADATFANRAEARKELQEIVVPDICNNIYDCINTVLSPIGTRVRWYDENNKKAE